MRYSGVKEENSVDMLCETQDFKEHILRMSFFYIWKAFWQIRFSSNILNNNLLIAFEEAGTWTCIISKYTNTIISGVLAAILLCITCFHESAF